MKTYLLSVLLVLIAYSIPMVSIVNLRIGILKAQLNQEFIEHVIDDSLDGARSVHALDLDGDGDIDIVGVGRFAHTIAWYENDGDENFSKLVISDSYNLVTTAYPIDLDVDGDIDMIAATCDLDSVSWWANNGFQDFGQVLPVSYALDCPVALHPIDIDGD